MDDTPVARHGNYISFMPGEIISQLVRVISLELSRRGLIPAFPLLKLAHSDWSLEMAAISSTGFQN